MDRRTFLSTAFVSTLLPNRVLAAPSCVAGGQSLNNRLLAWLMLGGGPDFRHMIAPEYDSTFDSVGNAYWRHRNRAHEIANNNSAWQTKWQNDFFHSRRRKGSQYLRNYASRRQKVVVAECFLLRKAPDPGWLGQERSACRSRRETDFLGCRTR